MRDDRFDDRRLQEMLLSLFLLFCFVLYDIYDTKSAYGLWLYSGNGTQHTHARAQILSMSTTNYESVGGPLTSHPTLCI